jgi:ATP-dependent DNA ligase
LVVSAGLATGAAAPAARRHRAGPSAKSDTRTKGIASSAFAAATSSLGAILLAADNVGAAVFILEMVSKRNIPLRQPPTWIRPQLVQLITEAPSAVEWLHEIKYDGYRLHADRWRQSPAC